MSLLILQRVLPSITMIFYEVQHISVIKLNISVPALQNTKKIGSSIAVSASQVYTTSNILHVHIATTSLHTLIEYRSCSNTTYERATCNLTQEINVLQIFVSPAACVQATSLFAFYPEVYYVQ